MSIIGDAAALRQLADAWNRLALTLSSARDTLDRQVTALRSRWISDASDGFVAYWRQLEASLAEGGVRYDQMCIELSRLAAWAERANAAVAAGGLDTVSSEPGFSLPSVALSVPAPPGVAYAPGYTVQPGDSLWSIAQREYGDGSLWPRLLAANADRITDPDLIQTGPLRVPTVPGTALPPSPSVLAPPVTTTPGDRLPAPTAAGGSADGGGRRFNGLGKGLWTVTDEHGEVVDHAPDQVIDGETWTWDADRKTWVTHRGLFGNETWRWSPSLRGPEHFDDGVRVSGGRWTPSLPGPGHFYDGARASGGVIEHTVGDAAACLPGAAIGAAVASPALVVPVLGELTVAAGALGGCGLSIGARELTGVGIQR